jgi:two-component system LytT family response regulator
MRAILIDDEEDSLEALTSELRAYCPDVQIVAAVSDAREGLALIRAQAPDLVFLDIEMPYLNAFEVLQQCDPVSFDVIFVTAYDEYAIKAFEFSAVDYLLKPVLKHKLIQSVQKVQEKQHLHLSSDHLRALINNVHLHTRPHLENIALPTSDGYEFVPINAISFLQSDNNYTWVHLQTKQKFLLTRTLKEMSAMISFPHFFRVHQTYCVNLNHVKKYVRGQGGYLVMKDGTQIPVSRANKDALLAVLIP